MRSMHSVERWDKNIDKTFIQSKMLNRSKGPAVHSLRAQADKAAYSMEMRKTLQDTEHLTIRQAEVAEIITDEEKIILPELKLFPVRLMNVKLRFSVPELT